jgi:hypothetical protein
MQKLAIIALGALLSACTTGGASRPDTTYQRPCGVGETCQNLGVDTIDEGQVLNQGLEADSDAELEAQAEKIRNASPEKLEKTIEKMERAQ